MTDAVVDKIEYGRAGISNASPFYDCRVTVVIRYAEFDWTEVVFHVHLPKKDYTISELKSAALQKARNALALLHRADYAVSPNSA